MQQGNAYVAIPPLPERRPCVHMLEVKELTKLYGTQRAVDNISFSVKEGEILGFLGPNGAGKSTTMKIATGYLSPTSGTVIVAGHDVSTHSMDVRRQVGYLPEHNPLYLDQYVTEFLRFVGSIYKLRGAELKRRVDAVVQQTGLSPEMHKKIGALSRGYRQRVGLAAALIHEPKVLILDEPTSGLDPNQIVEIRNLIRNLGKDRTVLFSTHIMQEVQAICDRIIIINKGTLVTDSAVAEVQDTLKQVRQNRFVYLAEFADAIQPRTLLNIPGVEDIKQLGANKYEILGASEQDLRPEIFKHAAQQGYVLIGLQQQEGSLEQLFRELTTK